MNCPGRAPGCSSGSNFFFPSSLLQSLNASSRYLFKCTLSFKDNAPGLPPNLYSPLQTLCLGKIIHCTPNISCTQLATCRPTNNETSSMRCDDRNMPVPIACRSRLNVVPAVQPSVMVMRLYLQVGTDVMVGASSSTSVEGDSSRNSATFHNRKNSHAETHVECFPPKKFGGETSRKPNCVLPMVDSSCNFCCVLAPRSPICGHAYDQVIDMNVTIYRPHSRFWS